MCVKLLTAAGTRIVTLTELKRWLDGRICKKTNKQKEKMPTVHSKPISFKLVSHFVFSTYLRIYPNEHFMCKSLTHLPQKKSKSINIHLSNMIHTLFTYWIKVIIGVQYTLYGHISHYSSDHCIKFGIIYLNTQIISRHNL